MGGPKRFDLFINPGSWALPLAIHLRIGRGNSALSIQVLCACFIFGWGRDFRNQVAA